MLTGRSVNLQNQLSPLILFVSKQTMYITKVIFDHYDWIYDILNDDMQNGFRVPLIVKKIL